MGRRGGYRLGLETPGSKANGGVSRKSEDPPDGEPGGLTLGGLVTAGTAPTEHEGHFVNAPVQRTKSGLTLNGPVLDTLTTESTSGIAALDMKWAALVLAGQAIDYAVEPGPGDALADVLRMTGLADEPHPFGWAS